MVGRHRVDADPLLGTVQAGARRRGHRCRVRLEGDGRERGRKRAGRKRGGAEPREGEGKRVSVVVRESEMKSASSRRKYGGVGGARRAGGRRVQEKENNSPSPSQRRHPDHGRARRSYTTTDAPRAHQVESSLCAGSCHRPSETPGTRLSVVLQVRRLPTACSPSSSSSTSCFTAETIATPPTRSTRRCQLSSSDTSSWGGHEQSHLSPGRLLSVRLDEEVRRQGEQQPDGVDETV